MIQRAAVVLLCASLLLLPYRLLLTPESFWNPVKLIAVMMVGTFLIGLVAGRIELAMPVARVVGILVLLKATSMWVNHVAGRDFDYQLVVQWLQFVTFAVVVASVVASRRDLWLVIQVLAWTNLLYNITDLYSFVVNRDQALIVRLLGGDDNAVPLAGWRGDRVLYAMYLNMIVPCMFYLLRKGWQEKRWWVVATFGFNSALLLVNLLLTLSRSGYVVFVGLFVWLLVAERALTWKTVGTLALVVIVAVVGLTFAGSLESIGVRLDQTVDIVRFGAQFDFSTAARLRWNLLALEIFLENPVFGIGLGNFTGEAHGRGMPFEQKSAENVYLQILAESGLLYGLALAVGMGLLLYKLRESHRVLPGEAYEFKIVYYAFMVFLVTSITLSTEYSEAFPYYIGGLLFSRALQGPAYGPSSGDLSSQPMLGTSIRENDY